MVNDPWSYLYVQHILSQLKSHCTANLQNNPQIFELEPYQNTSKYWRMVEKRSTVWCELNFGPFLHPSI